MSTFQKVLRFIIDLSVWIVLRVLLGIVAIPVLALVLPEPLIGFALFALMVAALIINEKGSAWYRRVCSKLYGCAERFIMAPGLW